MVRYLLLCSALVVCSACLVSCPSKYTLGFPGALPVTMYETSFGDKYPINIFYPDTEPPQTNLPVIIFNTGFNQPRGTYFGYGTQLAQWGYVAIIRFYPSPGLIGIGNDLVPEHVQQSIELIDWLDTENVRRDSPLFGMVDTERVGTTGHSLGATVAILHAIGDTRVKAMVSLDAGYANDELNPEELLSTSVAAHMYVISEDGGWCAQAPGTTMPLFDATKAPASEITIVNADHMDFEDSIIGLSYFGQFFCPGAPGPPHPQEVRDIATRYMISWYNVYLKDQIEFADNFAGPRAQEDIDAGLVKIRLKLENE